MKSSLSGLENQTNCRGDPLHWQRDMVYLHKLALASLSSGICSVGIVRLRTNGLGVAYTYLVWGHKFVSYVILWCFLLYGLVSTNLCLISMCVCCLGHVIFKGSGGYFRQEPVMGGGGDEGFILICIIIMGMVYMSWPNAWIVACNGQVVVPNPQLKLVFEMTFPQKQIWSSWKVTCFHDNKGLSLEQSMKTRFHRNAGGVFYFLWFEVI
jgi:hypothetical protein